jgi:hypothetical protein
MLLLLSPDFPLCLLKLDNSYYSIVCILPFYKSLKAFSSFNSEVYNEFMLLFSVIVLLIFLGLVKGALLGKFYV